VGHLSIEVRDHGPGVPPNALEHLFEPFYRVDEARARETGGSGIGLAICQRAIDLHRGGVRVRNMAARASSQNGGEAENPWKIRLRVGRARQLQALGAFGVARK
jgi:signal transduction histidine kinase